MSALDLWKSLGAKSLQCSITGFRLVIPRFLTLSTPWKRKKKLINNLNSSLVDHCGKLTRLNVFSFTVRAVSRKNVTSVKDVYIHKGNILYF